MKRPVIVFLCVLCGLASFADRHAKIKTLYEKLHLENIHLGKDCDTVVTVDDYSIRIIKNNDYIAHVGLHLFEDEFKSQWDQITLNTIETELLSMITGVDNEGNGVVEVTKGRLSDFKRINGMSKCNISNFDGMILTIEWESSEGRQVKVYFPMNYDTIYGGSRAEIENSFISRIKKKDSQRKTEPEVSASQLEPYGDFFYILPGSNYLDKNITRNIYFSSDHDPEILWDAKFPLESINNLFVSHSPYSKDIEMDLTIMKHDYGEKELLRTSLERVLAVAENDGCVSYWGVEEYDGKKLKGCLFLYNQRHGYDHVLQIECEPEDVIKGEGGIRAKASLFIPNNNVRTLFEPYRVKTDDEKIKY